MLNQEETLRLLRLAKKGDNQAKEELLENNKSLLKSIIKRFRGRGVEFDDLYQLASVGFVKAIVNFDESFDVRFSTYLVPMIVGEIKRFMRDDGSVKVSRIIKALSCKINAYCQKAVEEGREKPSVEALAKAFNVDKEDIALALGSSFRPISLSEKVNDDSDKPLELIERIAEKFGEEDLIDRIMLKQTIELLPEREQKIIVLRYFGDRTQSEVAKALGVSQVQVSRLETKIVTKLKKLM